MKIKLRGYSVVLGAILSLLVACNDAANQAPIPLGKVIENKYLKPGVASIDMQYSAPKKVADGDSVDIKLSFTALRPYPSGSQLVIELSGDKGLMLVGEEKYKFSLSDKAPYIITVHAVRESSTKPYLRVVAIVEYEGRSAQRRFTVIVGSREVAVKKPQNSGEKVRSIEAEETIVQSPK